MEVALELQKLTVEEAGFDYSLLNAYSGYYNDNEKLLKSASGGAVSIISEAIIRQGGVVFGVAYSEDFKRAEYRCVDNLEELELLKGSKYCETAKEIIIDNESKSIYAVLEEKIKENRLILFVGLGCDVGGVKTYCETKKLDTSKLFTIDILCYGPTTSIVHQQYIMELENKHHSKLKFFTVRYKKEGWTPPYIRAEFENGDVYCVPFYESDYGFALSHFSKLSCYSCKFKGSNHKADMTCGDFWGLTKTMSGWNDNGVSIMFVKTPKGEELIEMIDREIYHIEKADTSFALQYNHMYYQSRPKDRYYDQFGRDLREKGLHHAVKHFPVSPRVRIKRTIKAVLPSFVIKALKTIRKKYV